MAILLFSIYSWILLALDWVQSGQSAATTSGVERLGVLLMSKYLLAFELVGVLLLMALVGAAAIGGQAKAGNGSRQSKN
ncbi:MAG: hypothetical protein HC842_02320 [Cytophagales bacterium]|nr:hypothetical protein [Cytophagales bacterium]